MRAFITRHLRNLSRLRLVECNDWRSFTDPAYGSWRTFAPIMFTISRMRMENYTILATVMILGYGFQLQRKGYA